MDTIKYAKGLLSIGTSSLAKLPSNDLVGEVRDIEIILGQSKKGDKIGTLEFFLTNADQVSGTLLEAVLSENGVIGSEIPTRACRIEIDADDKFGAPVFISSAYSELIEHSLSASSTSMSVKFKFGAKSIDGNVPITVESDC